VIPIELVHSVRAARVRTDQCHTEFSCIRCHLVRDIQVGLWEHGMTAAIL
jgi:hypothetical protein